MRNIFGRHAAVFLWLAQLGWLGATIPPATAQTVTNPYVGNNPLPTIDPTGKQQLQAVVGIVIVTMAFTEVVYYGYKNPSPYPARAGCATGAGERRMRLAPFGRMPALSWS
jgi:hypothetical protein